MLNTSDLGNKICQLRRENNMTQAGLGNLLNVSAQAVSKWEKGDSFPDITLVAELAKALSCTTDYLLGHSNHLQNLLPELKAELKEMTNEQKVGFFGELIDIIGYAAPPPHESTEVTANPSLTRIQIGEYGLNLWAQERFVFIGTTEFLKEANDTLLRKREFPLTMVPQEIVTILLALLPDNDHLHPDFIVEKSVLRSHLSAETNFEEVIETCIDLGFVDRVQGGYKLNLKGDLAVRLFSIMHQVVSKPGSISMTFANRKGRGTSS